MMYSDIELPTQGDGRTMVLIGQGYFRGNRLAAIHYRIAAALIDVAIFYAILLPANFVSSVYANWAENYVVWLSPEVVSAVGDLVAIAVTVANVIVMQARTGQSFGKMCFGMIVVHPRVDPMNVDFNFLTIPSMPMLAVRAALHAIDLFLLIGVFSILLSRRRESIADKACNTLVLRPVDLDGLNIYEGMKGARDR